MTDITNSPTLLALAKAHGGLNEAAQAVQAAVQSAPGTGNTGASPAAEHQPIRPAVLRAAQLARDAEERARDRQHVKGKLTARERLDLLLDTGTFEEIGRFSGGNIASGNAGAAVITGFGEVYGRTVAVYRRISRCAEARSAWPRAAKSAGSWTRRSRCRCRLWR